MSRLAPRVCAENADIERLVALIEALPAHGHVVLRMHDGSVCTGVVQVRGSAQVFRDPQGQEGTNAEIILECPDAPGGLCHVWLDQVDSVQHLDSALASEN